MYLTHNKCGFVQAESGSGADLTVQVLLIRCGFKCRLDVGSSGFFVDWMRLPYAVFVSFELSFEFCYNYSSLKTPLIFENKTIYFLYVI